jgi:hypothetical protein
VYGSSATSVITPSDGKRSLIARTVRGTNPFGSHAAAASSDFCSRGTTGNSAIAGTPRATQRSASRSIRSTLLRDAPGSEGTGSSRRAPSSTNTG